MRKRLNSTVYTLGRFGSNIRETLDTDSGTIYSHGRWRTKLKPEDMPDDYVKLQSRTLWYMKGWVKTSGVKDLRVRCIYNNHLLKDDYIYISYDKPISETKSWLGTPEFSDYDVMLCGTCIVPVIEAIERNSGIDVSNVRNEILNKISWLKENKPLDYESSCGDISIEEAYSSLKGERPWGIEKHFLGIHQASTVDINV